MISSAVTNTSVFRCSTTQCTELGNKILGLRSECYDVVKASRSSSEDVLKIVWKNKLTERGRLKDSLEEKDKKKSDISKRFISFLSAKKLSAVPTITKDYVTNSGTLHIRGGGERRNEGPQFLINRYFMSTTQLALLHVSLMKKGDRSRKIQ